ncbi:MAG: hypothetical protein JNJ57_01480 [Saprospiraceae bacterium]|nr:hypothetical protein [Saprospiraceae bacterium]
MKTGFQVLASALLFTFLVSSCETAKKFTESGDYDSAIDLCVRKLRGKEKKQLEYVQGLEVAFKKAQERDLETIAGLNPEKHPWNWETVNEIHLKMRSRQDKVRPLAPLRAKNGYEAKFSFLEIGRLESESRAKAAEYLYTQAQDLISKGEKGDKLAARKASSMLLELGRRYYRDYRDKTELLKKARDLGTSYVLVEIKNQTGRSLPREFTDRLLAMSKRDLDTEWKEYFLDSRPGEQFDYKAVFKVKDIDLSPERVNERQYEDEKRIEDGWEYVLDKRGNVMKDTLGNDIKRTKYATVRAQVLEVHQTKAARLIGYVEIIDLHSNQLIDTRELGTEILFEHYAATFRGDERALSQESRQRIGSQPAPFPRDEDMIVQAAERIKPNLIEELRCNRSIL